MSDPYIYTDVIVEVKGPIGIIKVCHETVDFLHELMDADESTESFEFVRRFDGSRSGRGNKRTGRAS